MDFFFLSLWTDDTMEIYANNRNTELILAHSEIVIVKTSQPRAH